VNSQDYATLGVNRSLDKPIFRAKAQTGSSNLPEKSGLGHLP